MENNNQEKNIRNSILEKIKSGQVSMKPRWHFVLKTLLGILGIVILVLALIYLTSFLFFILRATGILFVPGFGFKGVGLFLISLPWVLIVLAAAFIILLEILVRRYSFGYKKPLLYTLIAILGLVVLGSLLVAQMGFHDKVFRYAERRQVPLVDPFYRQFGMKHQKNINPGIIREFTDKGLIIVSPWGQVLEVATGSETFLPYGPNFQVGDQVMVIGDREGTRIQAEGIRLMNNYGRRQKMRFPAGEGQKLLP